MGSGHMGTQKREGFVLVALMALSTIIVATVVSTACVVGGRHYKQYKLGEEEKIRAEAAMPEPGVPEAEREVMCRTFLV